MSAPSGVQNDIEHRAHLHSLYDKLFAPLQVPRVAANMRREDLDTLFMAARLTMFYAPSEALVRHMYVDLRALEAKGAATAKQYSDMFRSLVEQRRFDEANSIARAHPEISVEKLPAIQLPSAIAGPYALRVVDNGDTLVAEKFELDQRGSAIVAIGSPVCHFTQNAIGEISGDDHLRKEFEEHAVWIAPQDDRLHLQEFVDWNQSHPRQQMRIAYREEDFSYISSWNTPTFYFVRDGKVVRVVTGWPAEGNTKALMSAALLIRGSKQDP